MEPPKSLWNRNFLLLWQGQTVSLAGSSLTAVAFSLWIVDTTRSASLLGAVMMVGGITGLALSPLAGAVADRHSRVSILVASDLVLGAVALVLAGVFLGYGRHPGAAVAALFLLQVGESAANAFFATAAQAVIPDLTPHSRVPAANTVVMASVQAAGFVGKALGGLAYRLLGAPLLFLFDGLTFFTSAGTEVFIRVPPPPSRQPRGWRRGLAEVARDTRAGFSYVWRHEGLRTLTLVNASVAFFLDPLIVLLPFLVTDPRFLGATADWYGYLLAGFGLGSLGGYGLAALVQGRLRSAGGLATGCLAAGGLGFAAAGMTRSPGMALAFLTGSGVCLGMFSNHAVSRVQTGVPGEVRARALGVFQTLALCLSPLAVGLSGVVADATSRRMDLIFGVCGLAACLAALGGWSSRSCRELLSGVGAGSSSPAPAQE